MCIRDSLSSLVLLGDVFPLVVELFTTGEADLHFHQAAFEIDFQWHQGEAFFFDFSHQFVDLIAVHEKFFHAQRVFVEDVSFLIGADMHAVNEDFAVFNPDEGFLDAAFSHTKGFHLRTVKGNAGLKGIFNKEVMIGFFVAVSYTHLVQPDSEQKKSVLEKQCKLPEQRKYK